MAQLALHNVTRIEIGEFRSHNVAQSNEFHARDIAIYDDKGNKFVVTVFAENAGNITVHFKHD